MSRLRKTTIVACIMLIVCCLLSETSSAQIAGSYGAGLSPWWGTVPNAHGSGHGWTPSPIALYDENGKVTGSLNPVNGRLQGQGFMPEQTYRGYRNGRPVLYMPMNTVGIGGVTITPGNRQYRRHHRRW